MGVVSSRLEDGAPIYLRDQNRCTFDPPTVARACSVLGALCFTAPAAGPAN